MILALSRGVPEAKQDKPYVYQEYPKMLYHIADNSYRIVQDEDEEIAAGKEGYIGKTEKQGKIDMLKARIAYHKEQITADEKEVVELEAENIEYKARQAAIKNEMAQKLLSEAKELEGDGEKSVPLLEKLQCPYCIVRCDKQEYLDRHIEKKHPEKVAQKKEA